MKFLSFDRRKNDPHSYLLYLVQVLQIISNNQDMQQGKINLIHSTQFRGRNFHGKIQIKGDTLSIDITEFKKGGFYQSYITDKNLQKQFRRYLIFKNMKDLFDELLSNKALQISDENTLILPVDIIYKNRTFQLKIEIPLMQTSQNQIFIGKNNYIIKSSKCIFIGICGSEAKSAINANGHQSPYFMGFYLSNGHLYGNQKSILVASGYKIVDGQSIIRVEIDMNKHLITWFHNDAKLYTTEITKQLANTHIYPMVNLYTNGDIVELLEK